MVRCGQNKEGTKKRKRPMANIQNLKPAKKGEPSRNPKGRPKGSRDRATIVRYWLEVEQNVQNPLTGITEKLDQTSFIVLAQIKNARAGDLGAFKELMDSAFGKVVDKSSVLIDAEVKTQNSPTKGKTRAELRAYAQEKYGLNPDTLFLK
jgi:predicted metal-dependent RNase